MFTKRKMIILFSVIFILSIFTISCSKKDSSDTTTKTGSTQTANTKEVLKFNQEEFKKKLVEWQTSPETLVNAYEENSKNLYNLMNTDDEDYYIETSYNLVFNSSELGDKSLDLEQYRKNNQKRIIDMKDVLGNKINKYEISQPQNYGGNIVIITASVECEKKTVVNRYTLEKVADKWFLKNFTSN